MSPGLGVAVMMNNYFHDVATALLAASAFALWAQYRAWEQGGAGVEAGRYFLAVHARMTKLARFAFWWIILGGIPRTWFYRSFEWANAADKMQVPALLVKHVLAFAFVGVGISMWRRIRVRVREVEARVAAAPAGRAA
jgi:hypothetical protein